MTTDLYGIAASDFGKDFVWGVATAAYQIEGAWNLDGKGPSIWDTFSHRRRIPPTVAKGDTGDTACDFYHRYPQDIAQMAELGVGANRFSVSWPRVLPEGTGRTNRAGIDFYQRVVDTSLEHGIEPWVTLYHWDLPEALEQRGGWLNRDILGWWEEYVGVMADALGDRVTNWMLFNEPLSFCGGGYLLGIHAPGKRSPRKYMTATHHVNLCQAVGARVLRDRLPNARVGTTHILTDLVTKATGRKGERAVAAMDALMHRVHLEPNLGLGYPLGEHPFVNQVEHAMVDGDDEAIRVDFDFLGAQYYTFAEVSPVPVLGGIPVGSGSLMRHERTQMGWAVHPEGLTRILQRLHDYGRYPVLYVTENGMANPDVVEQDGHVHDLRRIDYLRRHLKAVKTAKDAGVPVEGFFYWSFMDNFEWSFGYAPRFGLVHVDYDTQERTVKDSGRWFQAFLRA